MSARTSSGASARRARAAGRMGSSGCTHMAVAADPGYVAADDDLHLIPSRAK
jgi:hypothetical protein